MEIRQEVYEYKEELINIRRYLHKNPEISFGEENTRDYILSYLKKLNPNKLEVIAHTGVKCVFYGKDAKKTIAIRADIDALPVDEKNNCGYKSKNKGVMHACGHDGHVAMALVCAKILAKATTNINYVFIFQPAEETDGGAQLMIEEGVLNNPKVDEIYALHLWPYIKSGVIGLKAGELMATMCDLNIEIIGKSAHGAKPNQGVDAILASSSLIVNIQSIVSRNVDPLKTAVITIGKIMGGEARNVICNNVVLEGTIRTFDSNVLKDIKNKLTHMLKGLEKMYNVKTRYYETMGFLAVENSKDLFSKAKALLKEEEMCIATPVMMSEDFSYYQRETDGLYAFLGITDEEHKEALHSNKFDFNEENLLCGVEYFLRMANYE